MTCRSSKFALTLVLLAPTACDDKQDDLDEAVGDDGEDETEDDDAPADEGDEAEPAPPRAPSGPCEIVGDARECNVDVNQPGMQFCDWQTIDGASELIWSDCTYTYVCIPGEERTCAAGGTVSCTIEEGVPYWPDCGFTPLVLSFDGGPVELAASSATFDVVAADECLASDWPSAANPWLVIDLDKNGFIDAGHELFGSGTVLPSGQRAEHGFAALALLDGNLDQVIDASDPRFAELLIWRDEDADKLSTGWELTSLADEGIERIELDFFVREQCDERGNCGRERSRFEFVVAGQRRVGEVVDVYLACP